MLMHDVTMQDVFYLGTKTFHRRKVFIVYNCIYSQYDNSYVIYKIFFRNHFTIKQLFCRFLERGYHKIYITSL